MNDKKYLDKVIGSLVRGTKMDYENGIIYLLFLPYTHYPTQFHFPLSDTPFYPNYPFFDFKKYCKNTFGLTEEENIFVWREYKDIILDKIEKNGR